MSEAQTVVETLGIARELTAFQRNILTILAEEPRYGLVVKGELETYYDDDVNHGRLYPNLDDLVEMGLVKKSELDKPTNQYALTEDGYQALLDQLAWSFDKLIVDSDRADDNEDLVDQFR
jgi:DNA-binding PadR family transcriptional regulator